MILSVGLGGARGVIRIFGGWFAGALRVRVGIMISPLICAKYSADIRRYVFMDYL